MDSQDCYKRKKLKIRYSRLIFLFVLVAVVVFASKNYSGEAIGAVVTNVIDRFDIGGNSDVVAKVNGHEITQTELDEKFASIPEYYQSFVTKKDLLEQMVDDIILTEAAESAGFDVSEEELMEAVTEIRDNLDMDETAFIEYLESQGLDLDEVLISMKNKLLLDKFLDETLFTELSVSDEEYQQFYSENMDMFTLPERIKASHILIKSQDEEALNLITELKQRIESGEDFAELAQEYSECPSSTSGGSLGTFAQSDMVPEFSEVAFNTPEGQISESVLTSFGYHIIFVEEKLASEVLSLEDAKENIEDQILGEQKTEMFKEYVVELRAESDLEIYLE